MPPASNWIELFAIPIASSIMETQPIAFILLYGALITGQSALTTWQQLGITLLLLSMRWWALAVKRITRTHTNQARQLHLVGLGAAVLATLAVDIITASSIPGFIISGVQVIGSWWYGIEQARTELSDEGLIRSFKIGFIALLALLVLVVFYTPLLDPGVSAILLAGLAQALPIFFLSGVIALSFTRLTIIRRENARYTPAGRIDSTRSWLIVLTLAWGAIVAAAIALETFSFQSIQALLAPLWNVLGVIVNWILAVIIWLLSFLLSPLSRIPTTPQLPSRPTGNQQRVPPPHTPTPPALDPTLLLVARLVLLALVIIIVLLVISAILKRWRLARIDNHAEEEIREGLSISAILRARRQERQQLQQQREAALTLETLDPTSARARYRDFLQTMAQHSADEGRRPNETPGEYQQRLRRIVGKVSTVQQDDATLSKAEEVPTDPAILAELTRAYEKERYGGKATDQRQQAYLSAWVPRLLQRLTGSPSTTTRDRLPANQGESKS